MTNAAEAIAEKTPIAERSRGVTGSVIGQETTLTTKNALTAAGIGMIGREMTRGGVLTKQVLRLRESRQIVRGQGTAHAIATVAHAHPLPKSGDAHTAPQDHRRGSPVLPFPRKMSPSVARRDRLERTHHPKSRSRTSSPRVC